MLHKGADMKFLFLLLPLFLFAKDIYFEGGKMSLEELATTVSIETSQDIVLSESLKDKYVYLRVGEVIPTERLFAYFTALLDANGFALNRKDNFFIVTPVSDLEYFQHRFMNASADDFKVHLNSFKDTCSLSKDMLFCSAVPKDIARIKKMVKAFDVPAPIDPYANKTLDIRLKIMESSYSDLLDLKNSLSVSGVSNSATGSYSASDRVSSALSLFLNGSSVLDTLSVSYIFDFLQKNGISTVMSEPNLLVTNGFESAITSGGTQKVIGSTSTNSDLSTTTKNYDTFTTGLQLKIQAWIVSDTKFKLLITLSNDDVVGGTSELPITTKQAYSTSIILDKNETVVLGGVIYDKHSKDNYKIPILGDIPILGIPFNTSSETKEKKVLTIALTVKDFK